MYLPVVDYDEVGVRMKATLLDQLRDYVCLVCDDGGNGFNRRGR